MIPTAEEFLKDNWRGEGLKLNVNGLMIEFAKMHVKEALAEASKTTKWKEQITMQGLQVTIIKSSILNSYPLTNIK